MKIRWTNSSNIVGFPDIDYGSAGIDAHIGTVSGEISPDFLPDWTLTLRLVFGAGDWIGVIRRGIPYPSAKEKSVAIVIPVPTLEQAPYGLSRKRFVHRPPLRPEYFFVLPADYAQHTNLRDHIYESVIRGISEAFRRGITVAGKKVTVKPL